MVWFVVMIISIIILLGLLSLFLPLTGHLKVHMNQEIDLELTIRLFSISIYSNTNQLSFPDFFELYLQPFLVKKKQPKRQSLPNIKLKKLVWISEIGLDQADHTALSVSSLMQIKGIVIQLILYYLKQPQDLSYDVKPNFDQVSFKSECECMFSTHLGQVIFIKLKR